MIDLEYEELKLIDSMPFDDYTKRNSECIKFDEGKFSIFFFMNNIMAFILSMVMLIYFVYLENLELFIYFMIGLVINRFMYKKMIYIHEKLHMIVKCFNKSNSQITLKNDKVYYGYININKWIMVKRVKAINALLMPWYIMVGVPVIMFLLFGINKYICLIIAIAILQHCSCIKDIYLAKLVIENSCKDNLIIFPPSKFNFGSVFKI